jgi:formate dehydrogenase subunit delta
VDDRKLVKMANEIASFFQSEGEEEAVAQGIAGHIRRFWEPRMRSRIYAWLDGQAGAGLKPSVLAALRDHRATLEPKTVP